VNLITLKTFDNPIEAHLYRTVLENEGIPCEIFGEMTLGLTPFYNMPGGGVQLKVAEEDLEEATVIIQSMASTPITNEEDEPI
jgi:hypothetical protein